MGWDSKGVRFQEDFAPFFQALHGRCSFVKEALHSFAVPFSTRNVIGTEHDLDPLPPFLAGSSWQLRTMTPNELAICSDLLRGVGPQ